MLQHPSSTLTAMDHRPWTMDFFSKLAQSFHKFTPFISV